MKISRNRLRRIIAEEMASARPRRRGSDADYERFAARVRKGDLPRRGHYTGELEDDIDAMEDYLTTTDQDVHGGERGAMMYGTRPGLDDPMYDDDGDEIVDDDEWHDSDDYYREMGWQRAAHEGRRRRAKKLTVETLRRMVKREVRRLRESNNTASGETPRDLAKAYEKKHGKRVNMEKLEALAVKMGWTDDEAITAAESAARMLKQD